MSMADVSYDARIIVGFGIAMITVVITAYAIAAGSGVDDASNLQLMSSFP
jgi:SpoU rRNA methylase family enzyme